MNANSDKVLLPNDVRRLLNVDNREIVELCKKTSVNPKKDSKGQIYFSELTFYPNSGFIPFYDRNMDEMAGAALTLFPKPNKSF